MPVTVQAQAAVFMKGRRVVSDLLCTDRFSTKRFIGNNSPSIFVQLLSQPLIDSCYDPQVKVRVRHAGEDPHDRGRLDTHPSRSGIFWRTAS
jgi:hypothetical protein